MLLAQKAQIWTFVVSFAKKIVRFEIITFQIGYMRTFAKIRKLRLSGTKCPKWAFVLKILENKCKISNRHLPNRVHAKFS